MKIYNEKEFALSLKEWGLREAIITTESDTDESKLMLQKKIINYLSLNEPPYFRSTNLAVKNAFDEFILDATELHDSSSKSINSAKGRLVSSFFYIAGLFGLKDKERQIIDDFKKRNKQYLKNKNINFPTFKETKFSSLEIHTETHLPEIKKPNDEFFVLSQSLSINDASLVVFPDFIKSVDFGEPEVINGKVTRSINYTSYAGRNIFLNYSAEDINSPNFKSLKPDELYFLTKDEALSKGNEICQEITVVDTEAEAKIKSKLTVNS